MKRIKFPVLNKNRTKNDDKLHRFRHAVRKQGILALCTVALTVVIFVTMTTAWYTNVVQTSGMLFETASWGFTGRIQVGGEIIRVTPGTSGVVPMSIINESDHLSTVNVTVSKSNMSADLQKRIFFYVDTALEQNGEQMQRVYLSETDGYSYLLGSQKQLVVTAETHHDAPVCWEWVYDMLGYYVLGTSNGTTVTEERYLRPIVYDYDEAVFDGEGKLLYVDGVTTVGDYLTQISRTDGYAGTISIENSVGGYYPVSVSNGRGVWAYLCNRTEIEQGIDFDTSYVNQTEQTRSFKALLRFTAQNLPANEVKVDSAQTLQAALIDESVDVIRLKQNIELNDTLYLPQGGSAVLDLNGYSISGGSDTLISVPANSNLSLSNGIIQGSGSDSQEAIRAVGSTVTMNGMTVKNVGYAVVVTDNLGDGDSRIKITNSELTSSQTAILLQGNGPESANKSQLIVQDSTISSDYIGISGQGSASGTAQYWGTDIQIIHSVIQGYWAGVYHPQQQSTLAISSGSVISGYTGIAVKGGDVAIVDSTIRGTGASQEPAASFNGWTDTGDGVYVEASYPWPANVVISGNSVVSSANRKAVELFQADGAGIGSIKIYGGTFTPDVTEFLVTQAP